VKVWRVQKTTDKPGGMTRPYGAVSRSWGFNDSPDAEILVAGYNRGKESGAVAVGRHGNFLQWGFSAPPSKMTDAGRKFFLNCICYITRFDGKAPLVRRKSSDRFSGVRLIKGAIKNPQQSFYAGLFPPELMEKYQDDADGMFGYYMENYELIYRDGNTYRIDTELKSLGIESNRKVETLKGLIGLLRDGKKSALARKLLNRYTVESFEGPEEWEAWLTKNRDRIYFSDVGGYKFRVVPQGYLDEKGGK